MAKKRSLKKPAAKKPLPKQSAIPSMLKDLKGDPRNPREIDDTAASGLQNSMAEFGDLSGIVFNQRTGELIAGHQRVEQIRKRWGDLPITRVVAIEGGLKRGVIKTEDGHEFDVRVVDWSKARQRAANVAANNHKIAGDFNGDLDMYLAEIQPELAEESPTLMNDLLLSEYLVTETVGQQSNTVVESMDLGEHEESESDIITIKFAFANEEHHTFVTHAVEHIKSAESFAGVAIDGQAIAEICKRYIRGQPK